MRKRNVSGWLVRVLKVFRMNADELKAFQDRLIERKRELIDEGDFLIEPSKRDAVAKLDEDEAPHTENAQVIASRRNRERAREIAGIEKALRRIELEPDEYGLCQECDEEIGQKRLELMPWVEFCVSCQSKIDDPQKNYRRRHAADYL